MYVSIISLHKIGERKLILLRNVQIRENRNQTMEAGEICLICGDVHAKKLIYPEFQPREAIAPFVGSAIPGGGFFVIPDIRNAAPAKKMHQAVGGSGGR
jgi:hypothetical protein